jgi:hypothetical protein
LAATLDGFVNDLDGVFEAKFMLPWSVCDQSATKTASPVATTTTSLRPMTARARPRPRQRLRCRVDPAEKHMAQLQHNMWVTNARTAALSIITGGGKWIEMTIPADALYQHFLVTAERRFWRCVQTGEAPRPYGVEAPRPRIEAVRVVDMSESNSWAQFAGVFCTTRSAFLEHERAKSELKALMPEDAKEASGHGVRAKRSKSGAVSFDLFAQEDSDAAIQ